MPASRVQVEVENGFANLHCPVCGAAVYTEAEGTADHTCEHVRFFIDWTGELSLAEPDSFAGEDQARQQQIIELVESTESWDDFLDKVTAALPESVLILELSDPEREGAGGEDDDEEPATGANAVVAFDFATPDIA
jgi:hypothetical protein